MKIMLDTNIFDYVIARPGMVETLQFLSAEKKLDLIITHVQEDEIHRIPDSAKKVAMMQVPFRAITTSGAIYGVSKYGRAKYGSGGSYSHKDIHYNNPSDAEDAIIALTSLENAEVLVTEDRKLRKRIARLSASLKIWSFEDFVNYTDTIKEE